MMKPAYKALVIWDAKQIVRDPTLLAGLLGPLLLMLVLRFGYPWLESFVLEQWSYALMPYRMWIASFLMQIIPMLLGMLHGFLMLDERDEQLIGFYSVTPITRSGYMRYRLAWPFGMSLLLGALYFATTGLVDFEPRHGLTLLLLAIEAPLFSLFLVAFASNKVEGLALSKASGLLLCAPLLVWLLPSPWTWLGGILPAYWAARVYVADGEEHYLLHFAVGLVWHVSLFILLLRKSLARLD